MDRKSRRVVVNDDGWITNSGKVVASRETIKDMMVDTYEGSPVDTLSWCVGGHEVYYYETEVGERIGQGYEHLQDEPDDFARNNLERLIETTGGPVTEIGRQFRAAGIGFFPSVRMSSHYEVPYASPRYGRFRREHPESLIGRPDEYIPRPTIEYAIRTGIDYKYPVVRSHMLAIIGELIGRFDVDGIELDYMRHPAYFRPEEAYANRYLMTDFIRRVRRQLDEVGAERGRHLDLLVRVPPTLYDSARIGIDVEAWIKEGLVDYVATGGGFIPFEMPIGEFVRAAEGTECRILGSLESMRWTLDEEVLRALAARFWDAGVDGLYFFNYFNAPNEWKRKVLGEMVDREKLPRLDKRYELDHTDRIDSVEAHMGSFRYTVPLASLPVVMEETLEEGGSTLTLDIADDTDAAAVRTLALGFDGFGDDDSLDVRINGATVPWDTRRASHDGWDHLEFDGDVYHTTMQPKTVPGALIEFDVAPSSLRKGLNELIVRFIKGSSPRSGPAVLKEVRLEIRYSTS